MNILAWNNKIGPWYYFVGLRTGVMINRDSWGYLYSVVRGEILGFTEDKLLRNAWHPQAVGIKVDCINKRRGEYFTPH